MNSFFRWSKLRSQDCLTLDTVEQESYLLEVCRYVVSIPCGRGWSEVRASGRGVVIARRQAQAEGASCFTSDWILGHFGRTRAQVEDAYRTFVSEGREQPRIWEQLQH